MREYILVVDQGTTSTRAIAFDAGLQPAASAQREFPQIFPRPGWVEHNPEDIWDTVRATIREVLAKIDGRIAAIGLANQRETAILWDRRTLAPISNAIVWQDRRTAGVCERLRREGAGALVAERAGLVLDPYFSATKIAWMLEEIPGARARAARGELAFGTVDSFLVARMTAGAQHVTDAANASRTSLFDIAKGVWDDDLLALFGIPRAILPETLDCAADFGLSRQEAIGVAAPILGVAGDQQAALIGQACFAPGMVKSTFGTGAFLLLNTGARRAVSTHNMLTTIAYQWGGQRAYALEGSIFSAGAAVQWLRDGLGIVSASAEASRLAAEAAPDSGVYLVPAFTGLGAPSWDAEARGLISGLTRGATRKEIARAALESVAFQTRDLVDAMRLDAGGLDEAAVRVDGGLSASDFAMQFLADMLATPVDRPRVLETTALGAAFLAGWRAGLVESPEAYARSWRVERRFTPTMAEAERARRFAGWREALGRCLMRP